MKLQCHICESVIDIPDKTKPGERITCPSCFAQLGLFKFKNKVVLGCAMCKEPIFDPGNCGDCERRREKQAILEEGRL
jgi:primosomal protein N'